jgi:RimJ/RimL family protein N-acetyltransferase
MVEIGYSVLRNHQRLGLATEMVEALVQWAREQAGVQAIEAETTPENRPSIRVLEHNQFKPLMREGQDDVIRYRLAFMAA